MSTNSTVLIPPSPNPGALAPVDKERTPERQATEQLELRRQEQVDAPEFIDFIRKVIASIRNQRTGDWMNILNSQARSVAYYDDRQYGEAKDGKWQDFTRRPGDIRPIDNQFKIQVDKLLMEFARAFPDLQVMASDPNDTKKVEGAKFAAYRLKTNRKRLLKKKFKLREAKSLLLKTMAYRYTFFNPQAEDSQSIRKPRSSKKTYGQTRSLKTCGLCGGPMKPILADGEPKPSEQQDMPVANQPEDLRCAKCGSNRLKMVEVAPQEKEVVDGYDEMKGGHVETRHVDPTMVRISLSARESVRDSPFLWYTQMIARCVLEAAYPEVRITNTGKVTEAAQYKRDFEGSPSNTETAMPYGSQDDETDRGSDGSNQFEELQHDLFWLDLNVYGERSFKTDQKLRGGRVLPAGQKIKTIFPGGMCVAATSADEVLDCYPEDKNKRWLFCVYGIREHALHGSGTNALLGPQDTRNDLKAYLIANNYYNAGRRESIRAGSYVGDRLPAMNEVAVVTGVPADKPIEGWAHTMAPGNPLPQQSMELYNSEGGSLQEGAGTSSLSSQGGAADLKAAMGTATGVAAMRDQAVGRMGPNLMLLTDMDEEHGYQILELEQENFAPERFLRMANQSITPEDTDGSITFSAEGVEAFMEMDIRADLDIEAIQGSWMPRTEAEKQAKFDAFVKLAAEITEKMGADPRGQELIAMAADVFGVDIKGGWSATEHVAAARIRALAKTCGVFEKRGLPPSEEIIAQVIASTPNAMIDKEMDNHPLFVSFYKDWWASDEGQSCSPLLRAVIKAEEILHRKGMVFTAQEMLKDKIESEAPQMIAAQATAAEAAQNAPPPEPPEIPYKEAPPDIKRQIEEKAGFQPSQVGESDPANAEQAKEMAKAQGTMQVQAQKAELEQVTQSQAAELKMKQAAFEHSLEMEKLAQEARVQAENELRAQQHEMGMKAAEMSQQDQHKGAELEQEGEIRGAELAHESQEADKGRQHESEQATADRQAEDRRMASEQQHEHQTLKVQQQGAEKLAKLKPPTRLKKAGGK